MTAACGSPTSSAAACLPSPRTATPRSCCASTGSTPARAACVRVRARGEIAAEERFSQRCYACALGGPDGRTLYALTAPTSDEVIAAQAPRGLVEQARVRVPGAGPP
jgi:sugar lactone lactonase YvrE